MSSDSYSESAPSAEEPIRIAVITPFKDESAEVLRCCLESVAAQTCQVYLHVLIGDGGVLPPDLGPLPDHATCIALPSGCEDTGASPRAIGAIYAISQGCNAVAYLDCDNTWDRTHLSDSVELNRMGADATCSYRWICHHTTREKLYVEKFNNAMRLIDTNTLVLFRKALPLATRWWDVPRKPGMRTAGVDRYFLGRLLGAIRQGNLNLATTRKATVFYRSRWTDHYANQECDPPSPAKKLIGGEDRFMHAVWVYPKVRSREGLWIFSESDLTGHASVQIPPRNYLLVMGSSEALQALQSLVSQRLDVCSPDQDRPDYFLNPGGPPVPVRDFEQRWQFDAGIHRWAADFSDRYLMSSSAVHVPANIYSSGLRPRFVFAIPDPLTARSASWPIVNVLKSYCCHFPRRSMLAVPEHAIQSENFPAYLNRFIEKPADDEQPNLDTLHLGEHDSTPPPELRTQLDWLQEKFGIPLRVWGHG